MCLCAIHNSYYMLVCIKCSSINGHPYFTPTFPACFFCASCMCKPAHARLCINNPIMYNFNY